MKENKSYKIADYQIRSNDHYALTKYRIQMGWLPTRGNLRVLNAGCGSGEMNIFLCQNNSWSVDAVDMDPAALEMSEDLKAKYCLDNLNIWHSDIESLPDEKDKYDIIVFNDVLEHVEDDVLVLKKLTDLLKPNGIMVISVPALQWLYGYHDEKLGHFKRYNKQNLSRKLKHFLKVEKSRYFAAVLIPIVLFYSCYKRKAYPIADLGKKSFMSRFITKTLQFLLSIESVIAFPLGTSVLVLATKP